MAFTVETGSGTPGANAYCSVSFVTSYLTDRGRETENDWSTAATAEQEESIVEATDYIDKRFGRRFKGVKYRDLVAGRPAGGTLTLSGLPLDTETITIGAKVYRFVNTLAQENDVLIGATVAECIANLQSAIAGTGLDTVVQEDTLPNYEVVAVDASPDLQVAAGVKGENGNLIAWEETLTNGAIDPTGGFLTGGLDEGEQPLAFPRRYLYTEDGAAVYGVPLKLRQATAEYAVRALAAILAPDPAVDDRLQPVVSKREKVGPIEEQTTYAAGGVFRLIKPYPAADRLLDEYVVPAGGVIRG